MSKTFSADHVRAAFAAGQRDFGENKVQEALQKIDATADLSIRWHLIGHLQSNKARKAGPAFAAIHSIDSIDLLRRVDQAAHDAGVAPDLYVQVDLAGEATKFGAPEAEVPDIVRASLECGAARLRGLMLLPPWFEDRRDEILAMLEPIRVPEFNQPASAAAGGAQPSHRKAEFVRAGKN